MKRTHTHTPTNDDATPKRQRRHVQDRQHSPALGPDLVLDLVPLIAAELPHLSSIFNLLLVQKAWLKVLSRAPIPIIRRIFENENNEEVLPFMRTFWSKMDTAVHVTVNARGTVCLYGKVWWTYLGFMHGLSKRAQPGEDADLVPLFLVKNVPRLHMRMALELAQAVHLPSFEGPDCITDLEVFAKAPTHWPTKRLADAAEKCHTILYGRFVAVFQHLDMITNLDLFIQQAVPLYLTMKMVAVCGQSDTSATLLYRSWASVPNLKIRKHLFTSKAAWPVVLEFQRAGMDAQWGPWCEDFFPSEVRLTSYSFLNGIAKRRIPLQEADMLMLRTILANFLRSERRQDIELLYSGLIKMCDVVTHCVKLVKSGGDPKETQRWKELVNFLLFPPPELFSS
jgi:hypothetical protein